MVPRASYPDLDEALLRSAVRHYESYPEEIEARVALNPGAVSRTLLIDEDTVARFLGARRAPAE